MGIRIQCAERKVKYIWSPEEASSVQSDPFKRGPIWNWIASSGGCFKLAPSVLRELFSNLAWCGQLCFYGMLWMGKCNLEFEGQEGILES